MERKLYMKPMAKTHVPRFGLLNPTLPVGSDPNDDPIEGKGTRFMDDEDEGHAWGRVWGRTDE